MLLRADWNVDAMTNGKSDTVVPLSCDRESAILGRLCRHLWGVMNRDERTSNRHVRIGVDDTAFHLEKADTGERNATG